MNTVGGTALNANSNVTTAVALGEVLFYTHALTPSERTKVEGYLKARWGTP